MDLTQTPTVFGKILNKKYYFLAVVVISILVIIVGWGLSFLKIKGTNIKLLSPLGFSFVRKPQNPLYEKILSSKTTDGNYPTSIYFPINQNPIYEEDLRLSATSYAVMDRNNRELLYSKNLTEEASIASVVKIMTVILALDKAPLDLRIIVSQSAAKVGEASMGLTSREKLSLYDLLYGAILPSGNDAAETIAEGVGKYLKGVPQDQTDGGGAREGFITEMNKKAQSLGMLDTYFFNPTGLDGEDIKSSSFSTPLDLLALANYALTNSTFAEIVSTKSKVIPYRKDEHKAFYLYNILELDRSFSGIKGIKPGNSPFAKETLVSYAENTGKKIIVVLLGSTRTKDDVLKVYKKVFGS